MEFIGQIETFCKNHKDKRIAMFVDMDGVISDLTLDLNGDIHKNTAGYFLKKKTLKSVISKLEIISKIKNLDMFILSACIYKEQAKDKSVWLNIHAPFFIKKRQLYVIKEYSDYTMENKRIIKVQNIFDTFKKENYDLAIYLEDEYLMLREAHKILKDKLLCFHISNLIE